MLKTVLALKTIECDWCHSLVKVGGEYIVTCEGDYYGIEREFCQKECAFEWGYSESNILW